MSSLMNGICGPTLTPTGDNYCHSELGLLNVKTSLYKPALDMFAPCVKPG
jgi:glucan phosphoethanolaminetransferase (alkaline phosphatase superfamily)